MAMNPIYLDNHSTTPVDPWVLEQMLPYFSGHFGNPSSSNHSFGWQAQSAVDKARDQVASLIGATSREITFTSGATESNNLAIQGAAAAFPEKRHFVTVVTEHPSVLDSARALEAQGYRVTYLPVDSIGRVSVEDLEKSLEEDTFLVSVMLANNEMGTIQDLASISKVCRAKGVWLHTDAVQGVGKIEVKVNDLQVDLLSLSSHKFYGPKGVGALYARRKDPRVDLRPILFGGGQERSIRPGTLNVPGIVGLGAACESAEKHLVEEGIRLKELRERILSTLRTRDPRLQLNGDPVNRLPGSLSLTFSDLTSEFLIAGLKTVAFSATSACSTEKAGGSHVLKALGLSPHQIKCTIRIGLGRFNTESEVGYFLDQMVSLMESHISANGMGLFLDPELRKTWRIQDDAYGYE